MPASSTGTPVIGVIDGKFESGYLVTVTIGSEKLKGVLYQAPQNPVLPATQQHNSASVSVNHNNTSSASLGVHRRRRKKSEIKRRDPAHPKPNRSGYNFFFAEQHARLKPLHHGKDREISRMIGELWNKLKEPEKAVRNLSNRVFPHFFLECFDILVLEPYTFSQFVPLNFDLFISIWKNTILVFSFLDFSIIAKSLTMSVYA